MTSPAVLRVIGMGGCPPQQVSEQVVLGWGCTVCWSVSGASGILSPAFVCLAHVPSHALQMPTRRTKHKLAVSGWQVLAAQSACSCRSASTAEPCQTGQEALTATEVSTTIFKMASSARSWLQKRCQTEEDQPQCVCAENHFSQLQHYCCFHRRLGLCLVCVCCSSLARSSTAAQRCSQKGQLSCGRTILLAQALMALALHP